MWQLPSPLHEWIMAVPLWIPLSMALISGTVVLAIGFGIMFHDLRGDK